MKIILDAPVPANAVAGEWKVQIVWHLGLPATAFLRTASAAGRRQRLGAGRAVAGVGRTGMVQQESAETIPPQVTY